MNLKTERRGLSYQFHFANVDPDPELTRKANLKLAQLVAIAPPGASATGVLERNERHYHSVIDVKSPYRSFHEEAVAKEPGTAIQRVLEKVEDRIYAWRFGRGGEGAPAQAHYFNHTQTQG